LKLIDARKMFGITQEKLNNRSAVNVALHICEVLGVDPRKIDEWKGRRPSS
jgi:hypothetical protein